MLKRLSVLGVVAVAIVVAVQIFIGSRQPPVEQPRRPEPPREQLPAVDPVPLPPVPSPSAELVPPEVVANNAVDVEALTLRRTKATSGARYASNEAVYWNKGAAATFEIRGRSYVDCAADAARAREMEGQRRGATFRALGNEPSWTLEITTALLTLTTESGTYR